MPYTTLPPGSDNPRDLWKWMAAYEDKTGGDVLAIAHNGNLSNGIMFPMIEPCTGKPIDREYAETRARWEPLYEATQIKGDGETHPFLSPNDEFANFERWDKGNLDLTVAKTPEMLEFEYARSALKNGLKLEAELGVNPYKFGMVGSTDAHTASRPSRRTISSARRRAASRRRPRDASLREDGQGRHHGLGADGLRLCRRVGHREYARGDLRRHGAPGDLRHDRPAHGRALLRRLGLHAADATSRAPAIVGYTKGVPMGGDLGPAPEGKAPSFLVAALKDPIGANLDRYQIVKGWLDAKGEVHEKVYRRGLVGRPQARRGRQAARRRQHGRCRQRHLDQHHRRDRTDRGVDGSGLRSGAARLLLRPRDRNPDATLDGLRRQVFRDQDASGARG